MHVSSFHTLLFEGCCTLCFICVFVGRGNHTSIMISIGLGRFGYVWLLLPTKEDICMYYRVHYCIHLGTPIKYSASWEWDNWSPLVT